MISRRLVAYASAAIAILSSPVAFAAPTIFFGENQAANGSSVSGAPVTARNAFLAGLAANVGSEGFESFSNLDTPTLNLTFTGSSGDLNAALSGLGTIYDTAAEGRFNTTPSGSNLFETSGAFAIDFGSTPISAFGFYATDVGDFNGQLTITLTDVSDGITSLTVEHTINGADGALLFWGFIDANKSYKKIAFGNTSASTTEFDYFGFDDMVIGDQRQIINPTPEPGGLALTGLALLGLAAARRKARG